MDKDLKTKKKDFLEKQMDAVLNSIFTLEIEERIAKREMIVNPNKKINLGQQSVDIAKFIKMVSEDKDVLENKYSVIKDEFDAVVTDLNN